MYRLCVVVILMLTVACGHRRVPDKQTPAQPVSRVFVSVLPPVGMSGDVAREYMRDHYWDKFDFSDTLFIAEIDTLQMLNAYAGYVAHCLSADAPAPMDSLMRKAAVSKPMLSYFAMLAEKVLYDPNSPLRSNELYISVLQRVVASPFFDKWEKIAPQHDLQLALQNRVGHKANDFVYTLASGATGRLSAISAEYTLLFINSPGCPMCREIREVITQSPMLNEMIEQGRLKVLAIYIDEDLTEWHAHREFIPASWINAYDKNQVITQKERYDLRAIPSLYLLDRDKTVLLKDGVSVSEVESVIDHRL
ncbi:MAG: DUF5106 domain-containing protein [Alistipes sp.]